MVTINRRIEMPVEAVDPVTEEPMFSATPIYARRQKSSANKGLLVGGIALVAVIAAGGLIVATGNHPQATDAQTPAPATLAAAMPPTPITEAPAPTPTRTASIAPPTGLRGAAPRATAPVRAPQTAESASNAASNVSANVPEVAAVSPPEASVPPPPAAPAPAAEPAAPAPAVDSGPAPAPMPTPAPAEAQ